MTSRPMVNFFQIASLLMLLVAVALLAAITTMHSPFMALRCRCRRSRE